MGIESALGGNDKGAFRSENNHSIDVEVRADRKFMESW